MAIVVVLAAVAMPSFAKQLETSRETADLETIRNAYVDAFADAMKDIQDAGALKAENNEYTVENLTFVQQSAGFQYITAKVAGQKVDDTADNKTISTHDQVTFTFEIDDENGGLSLTGIKTGTGTGTGSSGQTTDPDPQNP